MFCVKNVTKLPNLTVVCKCRLRQCYDIVVASGAQIFKLFMEHRNRFQGINSASLCSLAGRYDNPISTWFLAPLFKNTSNALLHVLGGHAYDHYLYV